jgi:hypothetical protein
MRVFILLIIFFLTGCTNTVVAPTLVDKRAGLQVGLIKQANAAKAKAYKSIIGSAIAESQNFCKLNKEDFTAFIGRMEAIGIIIEEEKYCHNY